MAENRGLPGLRGTEHVGITVPDYEEAKDFFVNVLGFEAFYAHGPFRDDEGEWMTKMLNVHPRAEIRKVQQFRCGQGPNIELFEYASPDQRREMPKNSDWGGHHLALYVDDIEAAVDHLTAHGVRIMNDGKAGGEVPEGPEAGLRSVYFLTPWGMQMELISFPNGKGYEKDTDRRLWNPTKPSE
ncbi:MAG: VOC family protein [Alphaproteobacteria bacterium]|nr:VOC family protein [Alphaproteobacteria bacterium]